jgi:hypothetical protein
MPKPYTPPTITLLDSHDVIRKLMHELSGPLGATSDERAANAAAAIRNVLERLPAEERDEAIARVAKRMGCARMSG